MAVYTPQALCCAGKFFVKPGYLRAQVAGLLLDGPDTEGYLAEVARPAAVSLRRLSPDVIEGPYYLDQVEDQGPEEHHHRERRKRRQKYDHVRTPFSRRALLSWPQPRRSPKLSPGSPPPAGSSGSGEECGRCYSLSSAPRSRCFWPFRLSAGRYAR